MKIRIKHILVILAGCLIFGSCTTIEYYQKFEAFEDQTWRENDTISFEFEIKDTVSRYAISLLVRHYSDYFYKNLWVMQKVTTPSGQVLELKKDLDLCDKSGKWHGMYLNDVVSAQIPTENFVRFSEPGTYKYEFVQLMRNPAVGSLINFGMKVQKMSKNDTERANNSGN